MALSGSVLPCHIRLLDDGFVGSTCMSNEGPPDRQAPYLFWKYLCRQALTLSMPCGAGACARAGSVAECRRASITDRAQGMEVLQRPTEGGRWPRRRMV